MKTETRAQAFDEKLADSRLFWLAYQKGFWCHGMMFFEADLVLGGDQPLCLDRVLRPVSGDLLLIGEGRRIEMRGDAGRLALLGTRPGGGTDVVAGDGAAG